MPRLIILTFLVVVVVFVSVFVLVFLLLLKFRLTRVLRAVLNLMWLLLARALRRVMASLLLVLPHMITVLTIPIALDLCRWVSLVVTLFLKLGRPKLTISSRMGLTSTRRSSRRRR